MDNYGIINDKCIASQTVSNDANVVEKVGTLTAARKRCKRGQAVIRLIDRVAVCVKAA